MSVVTDWTPEKAHAFGRDDLRFRHDLHERPMFGDAGLERVLDLYPRDRLGVFTMGEDPVDWRSWRRGAAQGMTGGQLLEAVKSGRIWLNLRRVDEAAPEYAALLTEIFDDLEGHAPGLRTFKRDMGLLISSGDAQVFYHLDVPLVTLWGLRGEKTLYVYPPEAPFVEPRELEAIVLKDKPEQFAFDPAWDARAEVFSMQPGDMITWRQNAPHRVVNGPTLNVSLSIEFMTPAALMRANVIYANGLLRRRAGLSPQVQAGMSLTALAKFGLARAAKAVRRTREQTAPGLAFRLDPARPGQALPL